MKTMNIKWLGLCLLMCTFTACFEDDSSLGSAIADLTIEEFEGPVTRVSYVGQKLEIEPVINGYRDDELDFSWSVVPIQSNATTDGYTQPEIISTKKNLSYEVNLIPGSYTVKLVVTCRANSYSVSQTVSLNTVTQFSQGFYVLKETADGNTDLDLLLEDGSFSQDLLSQVREDGAMKGAPLNLSIAYGHCYIDEETNKMVSDNMVCVTTKLGDINLFRTSDLKLVFDRSNLLYGNMEAEEKPYAVQSGLWMVSYFSNKGVRSNYGSAMASSNPISGKYGFPEIDTGGSIYMARSSMNIFFWDESERLIYCCDYNGGIEAVTDITGQEVDLSMYDCIGAGTNLTSTPLFIMQNRETKERMVYEISGLGTLDTSYKVDPLAHFAKGSMTHVNGKQAMMMYCVDNNELYGYDWTTNSERRLPLNGISEGETILYLSNQYFTSAPASDYLVVSTTTTGNDYNLYFYEILGGVPDGEPKMKVSGEGRVNNVRFVSSSFNPMFAFGSVTYPLTD